jgi:hypothetical protein
MFLCRQMHGMPICATLAPHSLSMQCVRQPLYSQAKHAACVPLQADALIVRAPPHAHVWAIWCWPCTVHATHTSRSKLRRMTRTHEGAASSASDIHQLASVLARGIRTHNGCSYSSNSSAAISMDTQQQLAHILRPLCRHLPHVRASLQPAMLLIPYCCCSLGQGRDNTCRASPGVV